MTRWFISRHPGAIEWVKRRTFSIDRFVPHLELSEVRSGDEIFGTLPLELAAAVCRLGARFFAMSLSVPARQRGVDLTADDLEALKADFHEYRVIKMEGQNEL
jgi:CRISPR-associated protein Csx16